MATYYFDYIDGNDSYSSAQAQNIATPWKTPGGLSGKSNSLVVAAGDKLLLKRGQIFYGAISLRNSGADGNPITLGEWGAGAPPIVRATTITTGWEADETNTNGGTDYKIARTTAVAGLNGSLFGVWEDDAPLFNATSRALMRPGSFWWDGSAFLYIRLYGDNAPTGHVIEVSDNFASSPYCYAPVVDYNSVNYWLIENLILERGIRAGVKGATSNANAGFVLRNVVCRDNDVGITGKYGTWALQNCNITHNVHSSLFFSVGGNAVVTARNCITGNTLGPVSLVMQTGTTLDADYSIDIGSPRGRYWLRNSAPGGTLTFGANFRNVNPKFKNAGAITGLSAALLSIGHAGNSSNTPEAYQMLSAIRAVNPDFNMSEQMVTEWTDTDTGDNVGGNWSCQAQYAAAGGEICPAGRNHIRWASAAFGNDFTNILYLGITATTATYSFDGRYLTTTVDGTPDLNIDTTQVISGFDCSILGWAAGVAGKTASGLIGYILSLSKGYAIGYVSPGPVDYQPNTYSAVATSVLSVVSGVDIHGSQTSNVAFDLPTMWETELWDVANPFAAGKTWINEYNANIGAPQITSPPIGFSWPYANWSLSEVATVVNDYGFKGTIAAVYNSSVATTAKNLYQQFYPGAMPILFPEASSEHYVMLTTQDGIDEAENQSAWLSAWDGCLQSFGEFLADISLDAVTAFATRLDIYDIPVKNITYPMVSLEEQGAILDASSLYLTKKIAPVYDFRLQNTSPCIGAGTDLGITTDIEGNQLFPPYNIGPYSGTGEGMQRASLTTPGPLNRSATVTAGTAYPSVTIKAPLGPEFQSITEWTGEAAVDLSTFAGSVHTRTGPNGTMIYGPEMSVAKIAQVDACLGA